MGAGEEEVYSVNHKQPHIAHWTVSKDTERQRSLVVNSSGAERQPMEAQIPALPLTGHVTGTSDLISLPYRGLETS